MARYQIGNNLLNAIKKQETGGERDPMKAVSKKGALGPWQIMPDTARNPGYGVKPLQNDSEAEQLRFTRDYMGALLEQNNGDLNKALAAYNAGQGNVNKYGDVPPFKETQGYVKNILNTINPIGEAQAGEAPQTNIKLPPGFVLDKQDEVVTAPASVSSSIKLPPGFVLDSQETASNYVNNIGHKAGVATRGIIEGVTGLPGDIYNMSQIAPGMVTDYLKSKGISQPLSNIPQPPRKIDTSSIGSKVADIVGLPKATEADSIIYPVSKTIGGFVLPSTVAAKFGKTGSVINKLGVMMGGNNPLLNTVGILAGQTASEAAKKSGQSGVVQLGANIAGNMAIGGAAGIANAAGRVIGRAGKYAVGAGLEGVAGRMLHRAAGEESPAIQAMLESGVVPTILRPIKGYKPTTSEIAGNAGISTLLRQSGLDVDAATSLSNRSFGNVKSISDYAVKAVGSSERKALMQSQGWQDVENIAKPMRERNLPVDLTGVRLTIDDAITKHTGNKAITKALEKVKKDLPDGDVADFNEIYNFKQGLDEALRANTMLNPQLASLQRAKTALADTKKSIVDAMTNTEPDFKNYITAQAKNISAISRRTAAEDLLANTRLATPMVSNASGAQEEIFGLSNNKLTALARNKKKMDMLSPAQQRIVKTVQQHAALSSRKGAGSMVGSSTAQNLNVKNAVANDLMTGTFGEKGNKLQRVVTPVLGIAGKIANPILSKFELENSRILSEIIAKAELNPKYAAELMKKYGLGHMNFNDSAGRSALRGAISQQRNNQ